MFGTLPLNKHGRLGVSGGNNLTGSRWDACSRKNKSLLNSSNYIISGLSFWLLNLKIWFPLFPFPCHWDRSCCFELRSSLVFCRLRDFKLLNFMCHLSRNMLFKLCSIFCVRILHLPRFHLSFFFVIWAYLQICLRCWRVNWTFHPTVKQYTSTFNIPERRARFTTSGWFRQRHISCRSHLIFTWFNPSILPLLGASHGTEILMIICKQSLTAGLICTLKHAVLGGVCGLLVLSVTGEKEQRVSGGETILVPGLELKRTTMWS